VSADPARVSILRYSPALVLFAIVIADARQHSDPDLWGHVLFGRQLLAHGALPRDNPYSYSAPGFPWLHHEWLSEVLMGALFDNFGTAGLKLLKFACSAGTICFIAAAESETIAPALVQLSILLVAALLLMPVMQFRPQLFDFVFLSATIALLARVPRRGLGMLWIAIPFVAIWSNLHGGFFIGLVAIGVYGVTSMFQDGFQKILWARDRRSNFCAHALDSFNDRSACASAAESAAARRKLETSRDAQFGIVGRVHQVVSVVAFDH
jgi:hypothetical protein